MNESLVKKSSVIYGGKLFEAVVFKDRLHQKPVVFHVDGDKAWIVVNNRDVEVEFNEKHQVWHGIGRSQDISSHTEALETRGMVLR